MNGPVNAVVRMARGGESEAYVRVLLASFPDKFTNIFRDRPREGSQALIEQFIDLEWKGHYVAELDGEIAGVLHLMTGKERGGPRWSAFAFLRRLGPLGGARALLAFSILSKKVGRDECYIAHLAVRPECQGRGMGKLLISTAVRVAKEEGKERLTLYVAEDNTSARSLYLAKGFRSVRVEQSSIAGWLLGKRHWEYMVKELG